MPTLPLQATVRTGKAKDLRKASQVPCILYGNNVESTSLQCEYNALWKAYEKAGESTLVELDIAGKKVPVLFHMIDFDPVSDRIAHVDFYAVDMKKEIEANVPLKLEGVSPAVKDLAAILVITKDHLTVRCLPSDLPHELTVSIEKLANFHDSITVKEVVLPSGVTVEEDPGMVIVTVQEPRAIEEEVKLAEAVPAEGGAEGEAAAAGAEAGAAAGEEAAKKEEGGKPEKKEKKDKKDKK